MQTVAVYRIRQFIAFSWLIGLMPAWVSIAAASESKTLRQWLESIARSQRQQNYEGTFIYRNSDELVSLNIVHAAGPGPDKEKLVVLDGPKRHLTNSRRHASIKSNVADGRATRVPGISEELFGDKDLDRHYKVTVGSHDRVAGRETRVVHINARDHYRYGFDLGVDLQSGLVLRVDRLDHAGRLIEQVLFTGIRFISNEEALALLERIDDAVNKPPIVDAADHHAADEKNHEAWTVERLPAGFSLADRASHALPASSGHRLHLVFSDGLASVSVFIESFSGEPFLGLQRVGAMNVFGNVSDGHQIIVVGDVPSETVKMVGQSVHHDR